MSWIDEILVSMPPSGGQVTTGGNLSVTSLYDDTDETCLDMEEAFERAISQAHPGL